MFWFSHFRLVLSGAHFGHVFGVAHFSLSRVLLIVVSLSGVHLSQLLSVARVCFCVG